jgi:hypothetical protein
MSTSPGKPHKDKDNRDPESARRIPRQHGYNAESVPLLHSRLAPRHNLQRGTQAREQAFWSACRLPSRNKFRPGCTDKQSSMRILVEGPRQSNGNRMRLPRTKRQAGRWRTPAPQEQPSVCAMPSRPPSPSTGHTRRPSPPPSPSPFTRLPPPEPSASSLPQTIYHISSSIPPFCPVVPFARKEKIP